MRAEARWSRGLRNQQALGGKGARRAGVWLEKTGAVELAHGFIRVKERQAILIVHSHEAYCTS